METIKIESRVSEVRFHTVLINGQPCVIAVLPNGTVEISAVTIKSAEPRVKAVKQSKPAQKAQQQKAPVQRPKGFLSPIFDADVFNGKLDAPRLKKFVSPSW